MSQVLVLHSPKLAKTWLPITEHYFDLPEQFSGNTFRLALSEDDETTIPNVVADELNHHGVDFGILENRKFADMKLLVSDMDSTLITIECIDEIAQGVGLKEQVSEITERAMRGELDFEQSLRERVALLQGVPESHLNHVYEKILTLSQGAEQLVAECKKHKIAFLLVSGGFTFFTEKLRKRLGLDWAFANQLEVKNGVLTGQILGQIIDAQSKVNLLEHYRKYLGAEPEQVIAVGDGANDIPMLAKAGVGVAFHAKPKTQAAANVSIRHGGLDVIRAFFE